MNKKLFLRCSRIANKACEHWLAQAKKGISIGFTLHADLKNLEQTFTTILRHSSIISDHPSILRIFRRRHEERLKRVTDGICFMGQIPRIKPHEWRACFARGLYQLIDKECVSLDRNELRFQVESVTIEDVELGDFQIEMDLYFRDGFMNIGINSLSNPQLDNPHPHIRGGDPCLGEASACLQSAWETGDITSVVDIMEGYLRSYNENSAYKKIYEILGVTCKDCGHEDDDMSNCDGCDEPSCCQSNCEICEIYRCSACEDMSSCDSCNKSICHGCSNTCSFCDTICCENCIYRCEDCDAEICDSCRTDDLCESCKKVREAEKKAEEDASVNAE